jgi:protein-S-isoprenylcysteine O-methyltransferase Ste14
MKTKANGKLIIMTITRYLLVLGFLIVLIFLPAGSFKFWNGWVFIGALFIPMIFVMGYLLVNDPDLLVKRMKTREKEKPQKLYLVLSIIVSVITYVLPGLDYRFHWSSVPVWLVLISTVIMITGYILFFIVMKQNSYASRVIEIQEEQKLIDTGLYSLVRHPMYFAATILYGFSPLILGSYFALIPMIFIPVLLVIRIRNEEKVLIGGLKGYEDYMKRVKFRFIPFIW